MLKKSIKKIEGMKELIWYLSGDILGKRFKIHSITGTEQQYEIRLKNIVSQTDN
jgi:hypothetical protein